MLEIKIEGKRLKDWDLRELRRRHANELVSKMLKDQGRNPGGCRAILRALSAFAEDAITDELCELNPWKGIKVRDSDKRAKKPPNKIRVWTFDEMHEFASHGGQYEPMLRTVADCGVRLGECIAIQRTDYHGGEIEIRFTAWRGKLIASSRKNNHDRIVPVPPRLDAMLKAMPVQLHSHFLFPTPNGHMWLEENWRRDVWKPTVEAATLSTTCIAVTAAS